MFLCLQAGPNARQQWKIRLTELTGRRGKRRNILETAIQKLLATQTLGGWQNKLCAHMMYVYLVAHTQYVMNSSYQGADYR